VGQNPKTSKMKNIRIIKAKGCFEFGKVYPCHENTAQMLINGGFGVEVSEIKEKEHAKPKNKIAPDERQANLD